MQAINWLDLQPLPEDLEALHKNLHEVLPLRQLCQLLVETTLHLYPWTGRADLIPCYHPSQTYKPGQKIALFIAGTEKSHRNPVVWLVAQVKQVKDAENPIQGCFQVLTLDVQGRQIQMAAGIPNTSYLEPDLSGYESDDLAWLVKWVSETYAASLHGIIRKLIQTGQIRGRLVGENFLPEEVSGLSPELLHPIFARLAAERPWISVEEMIKDVPNLSPQERETVLGLLPAALKKSSYRPLGGNRWTTPERFQQLNREVPQGLPSSQSPLPIWTKQDEKDLASYVRKSLPTKARDALAELGIVERMPKLEEGLWRPPKSPVRLPALNYLHLTQGYFPVGSLLHAFAPDVPLVFVQLISGDYQPFLLDREQGLLKAIQPQEMSAQILKQDIPAGTSLWLEYEGKEQYRIVARRLPFKRMVPCKLARLVDSHLRLEHLQISMMYDGGPSLFKTNLRFEEMEALLAEAARVELSLREAIIYAIQELCATDPDGRAHQADIFNAVFLQRLCSPHSVSVLLYTQPCFEQLTDSYFRYKPISEAPVSKPRKRKDGLSTLWDLLLSKPVAPDPVAEESMSLDGDLENAYPVFSAFTSDLALPSHLETQETNPEYSVLTLPLVAVETNVTVPAMLKEDEPDSFPAPVDTPWQENLDRLLLNVEEPVRDEPSNLPPEEAAMEPEPFSEMSMEAAHVEALTFYSSFPSPPKPAWIEVQSKPDSVLPNRAAAQPRAYIPKIPAWPLHKQPLYRRLFFYLQAWLKRIRKTA